MYLVTIYDGADDLQGTTVHTPYTNGEKLSEGKISLVGDGIDSFDFRINPSNPAWNRVRPLTTLIDIVDVGNNKTVFDGRILKPVQTMSAGGQFNIKYVAESKLAYLRDSTQPHGEINNMTVKDFLEVLITNHNADLEDEPHKHFELGEVTVTTSTDNVYRFLNYEKTWDAIQDKLVSRLGGHIRLRDGKYIDYLETVGELGETPIELKSNLKDMQKEIDPTGVITKLKPLGARIETEEASVSEPRVDIKSVNDGKDYLIDEELVKEFGIISESMVWDNVNTPSTVMLRGQQFFQAQRATRVSYNVTVPNMHLIDITFEEITVDDWYPLINPVLAVDEPIQVIGKEIDINNPQMSKLQIGDKHRTLSEYQVQANRQAVNVERLEEQSNRQRVTVERLEEDVKSIDTRTDNYWQTNNVDGDTPNMIAGNKNNHITPNHKGSNIGGGGSGDYPNQIFGNFSTISGGYQNIVSSPEATIGGGKGNSIYAENSTISGGENGLATSPYGVIGGGRENAVHGQYGSLVGGESNSVNAEHGVIGGGKGNRVSANYGTVLSGQENQVNREHATVVNGRNNYSNSEHATILNGQENEANAHHSTVLNGENNSTTAPYASVLAGRNNSSHAESASILSGEMNEATGQDSAVIGREALSVYPGSLGHGYGKFGEESRAQSHEMKLIRTTTDTNETVLGFDHTDETLYFINRYLGLINLEYLIMAQSASGVAKVWKLKAFLANTGNGLEVLNTPTKEVLVETTSNGWDVSLELGEESEWGNRVDIKLNVTGGNETVHWLADLKTTEITIPME